MGARLGGEVRVTSYIPATDILWMRRIARRAGGRIESTTDMLATNPPQVAMVTIFPSTAYYADFQTRVENHSRGARDTSGGRPAQRRSGRAAA